MAAAQDRTAEFRSAVQSMRSRQMGPPLITPQKPAPTPSQHREFTRIAKLIAKDLSSTYEKLEKLSQLASNRAVYGDRPAEVQELTYIVQQDMQSLNRAIKQLQDFAQQQRSGTKKDLLLQHSTTVVVSLQSRLAGASRRFKGVLETRSENLKAAHSRREQFADTSSVSSSVAMPTLLGNSPLSPPQQQQLAFIDRQESYIQDRARALEAVNATIVELGGIFQQLATMVHEQGEQVDRIDANVADAEMNVDAAHSELSKYLQSVTANRWLMLKIFGVLIFFFIIFVVFAA